MLLGLATKFEASLKLYTVNHENSVVCLHGSRNHIRNVLFVARRVQEHNSLVLEHDGFYADVNGDAFLLL